MDRKYQIVREPSGVRCTVVSFDGRCESEYFLPHVEKHSPTGFEYGYGGSGPADLALSILCDHFNENPTKIQLAWGQFKAQPYYMGFKWAVIAPLSGNRNTITTEQIEVFLEKEGYTDDE